MIIDLPITRAPANTPYPTAFQSFQVHDLAVMYMAISRFLGELEEQHDIEAEETIANNLVRAIGTEILRKCPPTEATTSSQMPGQISLFDTESP